jgi:hypothetical protein
MNEIIMFLGFTLKNNTKMMPTMDSRRGLDQFTS